MSYLIACAKGLSDPEGDLYDLEDSFDDTEEREGLNRIFADERIIAMRVNLGSAIEGCARIWGGDAELVAVDFLSPFLQQ